MIEIVQGRDLGDEVSAIMKGKKLKNYRARAVVAAAEMKEPFVVNGDTRQEGGVGDMLVEFAGGVYAAMTKDEFDLLYVKV